MFDTIKLDLETQKQMVVQAIESKISDGTMTDVEEDFWEEVIEEVGELKEDDIVVVLFHDHGSRYVGKIFNDEWMKEQGFI